MVPVGELAAPTSVRTPSLGLTLYNHLVESGPGALFSISILGLCQPSIEKLEFCPASWQNVFSLIVSQLSRSDIINKPKFVPCGDGKMVKCKHGVLDRIVPGLSPIGWSLIQ